MLDRIMIKLILYFLSIPNSIPLKSREMFVLSTIHLNRFCTSMKNSFCNTIRIVGFYTARCPQNYFFPAISNLFLKVSELLYCREKNYKNSIQ